MPKVTIPEYTAITPLLRLQSHIAHMVKGIDGKPLTDQQVGHVTSIVLNTLTKSLDPKELQAIALTVVGTSHRDKHEHHQHQ